METLLTAINLSLSSSCGANCIYCPSDRGTRLKKRIMDFEDAKKIIDEITTDTFINKYKTTVFNVGENGDAFINKSAINILRYIKEKNKHFTVICFSNFQNLTVDKLECIVKEKLVDIFNVNIDGFTGDNYFAVKRIKTNFLNTHLSAFFKLRETYQSSIKINISVLTLNHYINTVKTFLGCLPKKLTDLTIADISDDYQLIKNAIVPILGETDGFGRMHPFFWAEREGINKKNLSYENYSCPLLGRVKNETFIAPDGTWYACCYDSNNYLAIGNVFEESVAQVASSPARETLINQLEMKKFEEIGPPCNTVNCCYSYIKLGYEN